MLKIFALGIALGACYASPSHAEIALPWEELTNKDNPFATGKGVSVYAGSGWLGGSRGIRITCDGVGGEIMEISDFDLEPGAVGMSLVLGIAVDGAIIHGDLPAKVVELTSGKMGLSSEVDAGKLRTLAQALVAARKNIHVNGLYKGAQEITASGSTAAGKVLLGCIGN